MTKFKSGLELKFHNQFPNLPYEKVKLDYIITHKYCPDFQLAPNMFVETKGKFLPSDRNKHLYVREQNPEVKVLFVFQQPFNLLSKKSKMSYAGWCEKHNFAWLHINQIQDYSKDDLIAILNGKSYIKSSQKHIKPFWEK